MRKPGLPHGGFTILETAVALGLVGLALVATAQMAVWVLAERGRDRDQQAALELAANLLESARAVPWGELTSAWAAGQRLPTTFEDDGWQLSVRVASEPKLPRIKRITVVVRPAARRGNTAPSVELATLLADHGVNGQGVKP